MNMSKKVTGGYQAVYEFMYLAKQETPTKPMVPDLETRKLRAKLILEEAFETIENGLGLFVYDGPDYSNLCVEDFKYEEMNKPNLIEIVDGCEDIRVVTTGTLVACGVQDGYISEAVDNNNLAKFGPGGYRRDDGKWIKPPDHKPPDIKALLMAQGWDGQS